MPTARQQLDLVQERNRLFKLREPKFGLGLKTVRELELISALSFLFALVKWPSARSGSSSGSGRGEKTKKRKKSGENRDFVLSRKTGGRPGKSPGSENGGQC